MNEVYCEFSLECTPVPKMRPRMGMGRVYTPKKTIDFEKEIGRVAYENRRYFSQAPREGMELVAEIEFLFHYPKSMAKKDRENAKCIKKPDLDNLVKSVLDGMNGVIYKDDSMITHVNASKAYHDGPDLIRVKITGVER